MAKRLTIRRFFLLMSTLSAASISTTTMAAAFQLWELDAASMGNYHAGTAAIADDASTAMYNPAGLVRIKNQQLVAGVDPALTNFLYRGTVRVSTLMNPDTFEPAVQKVSTQGGGINWIPFGHYAAPITENVVFGMSIDVPFGLKTDYGASTAARYAATLTKLQVVDYSPSLGIAINDKLSVGAGLDIQRLAAEFDEYNTFGVLGEPLADTQSVNKAWDVGYGYRLGVLYQFNPCARLGVNYRSKVTHHARGNSKFIGPLAENTVSQYSPNLKANATLPAITSLSLFHTVNPCWDLMGSVAFTQWSVFRDLILQNVAGVDALGVSSNSVVVIVPEHYHNAWNYSVGANYRPNEKWILRTGVGYDQTPSNNTYRNLELPDSNRIAVAMGAHYQASKQIGIDAGYTHLFVMNTRINNVTQQFGPEQVTTNGSMRSSADVYGVQLKWDIA